MFRIRGVGIYVRAPRGAERARERIFLNPAAMRMWKRWDGEMRAQCMASFEVGVASRCKRQQRGQDVSGEGHFSGRCFGRGRQSASIHGEARSQKGELANGFTPENETLTD